MENDGWNRHRRKRLPEWSAYAKKVSLQDIVWLTLTKELTIPLHLQRPIKGLVEAKLEGKPNLVFIVGKEHILSFNVYTNHKRSLEK